MSHPEPKFSVGQRVICCRPNTPEHGKSFIVLDLVFWEDNIGIDAYTGKYMGAGWRYKLQGIHLKCNEIYLRPIPDEDDNAKFERFKKKLNIPTRETVTA